MKSSPLGPGERKKTLNKNNVPVENENELEFSLILRSSFSPYLLVMSLICITL